MSLLEADILFAQRQIARRWQQRTEEMDATETSWLAPTQAECDLLWTQALSLSWNEEDAWPMNMDNEVAILHVALAGDNSRRMMQCLDACKGVHRAEKDRLINPLSLALSELLDDSPRCLFDLIPLVPEKFHEAMVSRILDSPAGLVVVEDLFALNLLSVKQQTKACTNLLDATYGGWGLGLTWPSRHATLKSWKDQGMQFDAPYMLYHTIAVHPLLTSMSEDTQASDIHQLIELGVPTSDFEEKPLVEWLEPDALQYPRPTCGIVKQALLAWHSKKELELSVSHSATSKPKVM